MEQSLKDQEKMIIEIKSVLEKTIDLLRGNENTCNGAEPKPQLLGLTNIVDNNTKSICEAFEMSNVIYNILKGGK